MTESPCDHTYTYENPMWKGLRSDMQRDLYAGTPYNVRFCTTCGHDDWEPKDKALWEVSGAESDSWRYSAMYQWRYPSRSAWSGYPEFRKLFWFQKRRFLDRLRNAATYEEGSAIIEEVLK